MIVEGYLQIVGEIGGGGKVNEKRTHVVYSWLFVEYLRVIDLELVRFSLIGKDWGLLQQDIIGSGCKGID
jgi:hypothetical protein